MKERVTVDDIVKVAKTPSEKPKKNYLKKPSKKVVWVLVAVLVIALAGTAGWLYKENRDLKADPASAQTEKNKAETARILDKVSAVILVTETEAPTVARVEDPEKLKSSNPEFYKNVQKGDYLIIFPKRAIIFRESNNQIINIAPIINTADLKANQGTTPASDTEQNTSTEQ